MKTQMRAFSARINTPNDHIYNIIQGGKCENIVFLKRFQRGLLFKNSGFYFL